MRQLTTHEADELVEYDLSAARNATKKNKVEENKCKDEAAP
jgi:hypothetical protein